MFSCCNLIHLELELCSRMCIQLLMLFLRLGSLLNMFLHCPSLLCFLLFSIRSPCCLGLCLVFHFQNSILLLFLEALLVLLFLCLSFLLWILNLSFLHLIHMYFLRMVSFQALQRLLLHLNSYFLFVLLFLLFFLVCLD